LKSGSKKCDLSVWVVFHHMKKIPHMLNLEDDVPLAKSNRHVPQWNYGDSTVISNKPNSEKP
jgi:hypothetical protein